jgi:hypothetical protein
LPRRSRCRRAGAGLEWAKASIIVETARAVAIKALIERDRAAGLAPTKQGRAVLGLQYFDQCGPFGSTRMIQSANDCRKHVVRTAGRPRNKP